MGLIAITAAISLYFTSNVSRDFLLKIFFAKVNILFCFQHGVTYFTALSTDTYITQTAINLLLILIVLWIYGRVRFQRDIEFMINERFSTWKINILRFVAPLGMLLALVSEDNCCERNFKCFSFLYTNSYIWWWLLLRPVIFSKCIRANISVLFPYTSIYFFYSLFTFICSVVKWSKK